MCHGWRPAGTRDWLLLYGERGAFTVRPVRGHALQPADPQAFTGGPGDIIIYRPGTPQDYGQHRRDARWRHIWVHWLPRPEVTDWLREWPELWPGVHHVHVHSTHRAPILRELVLTDTALNGRHPHREQLALNALERALLLIAQYVATHHTPAGATPSATAPHLHPHTQRIERAARLLAGDLTQTPALEDLARQHGLSRSRFAALFTQHIGHTPRRYQELQRLARARDLLLYTNQDVQHIAEQLGFSTPFYFSLRFRGHYGHSPRHFRQRARRDAA